MANERLIFEVIAQGKNLKAVQLDANKLADSIERTDSAYNKTTQSQDRFHKGQKGVAGVSANSTKNFSKMRNAMGGGSSGLVGAYATLAANVFALTAAFGALQRAAQFEQLRQGLVDVGLAAGQNLTFASEQLVELTGNAISAEQAMRSTAVGMASGFSATQIEELTTVAMGASRALGRDLADAMDRLIRGTAKLEPEILDELGILVRLDDAAEDYAARIGKTVQQLSVYEKQQAFANAVSEQGIKKYGALADAADPNPYTRLAAAMADLQKTGVGILNFFLVPLVDFLADSQVALAGATALFASTIGAQLIPGLTTMADTAAAAAAASGDAAAELAHTAISATGAKGKVGAYAAALADGTQTQEGYNSALRGTSQRVANAKKKMEEFGDSQSKAAKAARAAYQTELVAQDALIESEGKGLQSKKLSAKADAINYASQGKLIKSFKKMKTSIIANNVEVRAASTGTGIFSASLRGLRMAAFGAGVGIKALGASILAFLPWIGIIVLAFEALRAAYNFLFPPDASKEKSKAVVESFDAISDSILKLEMELVNVEDPLDKLLKRTNVFSGNLQQVVDGLNAVNNAQLGEFSEKINKAEQEVLDMAKELREAQNSAFDQGNVRYYTNELARAKQELAALREEGTQLSTAELTAPLDKAILSLEGFGDTLGDIDDAPMKALRAEVELLSKSETIDPEEFKSLRDRITTAIGPLQSFNKNLQAGERTALDFSKVQNKLFAKGATPYDDVVDGVSAMAMQFDNLEKIVGKGGDQVRLFDMLAKALKLEDTFGVTTQEGLNQLVENLTKARARIVEIPGQLKEIAATEKMIGIASKVSVGAYETQLGLVEDQKKLKIEQKDAELAILNNVAKRNELGITEQEAADKIKKLTQERNAIQITLLSAKELELKSDLRAQEIEKARLDRAAKVLAFNKKTLDLKLKQLQAEQTIANYTSGEFDLGRTAEQELSAFRTQMGERQDILDREKSARDAKLEVEFQIADINFRIIKARLEASRAELRNDKRKADRKSFLALAAQGAAASQGPEAFEAATQELRRARMEANGIGDALNVVNNTIRDLPDLSTELGAVKTAGLAASEEEHKAGTVELVAKELELVRNITKSITDRMGTTAELTKQAMLLNEAKLVEEKQEGESARSASARLIVLQNTLEVAKALNDEKMKGLDADQKALDISQRQAEVTNRLNNQELAYDRRRTGGKETDKQKADRLNDPKFIQDQNKLIDDRAELAKAEVENEHAMAKIKFDMINASYRLLEAELANARAIAASKHGEGSKEVASLDTAIATTTAARKAFDAQSEGVLAAMDANKTTLLNNITNQAKLDKDELKAARGDANITASQTALTSSATGDTTFDRLTNLSDDGGLDAIDNMRDKFAAVNNVLGPMKESLAALGPDGELISQVATSAFAITDSWMGVSETFEKTGDGMKRGAAIASAIGSTIAQVGAMMAASSKAKIAGIDAEIAAEKKRDGKSKESQAKIAAMEKRKEAIKRKAFEQNKKMQMASVVANTAAAIMATAASNLGAPWAIPMMVLMGAMGAAQLAMIAGTSYEGGASSAGGGMPTSVSVGERNKRVDVARGGNMGGELAYLRGERGTGTSSADFRPTFSGRYRATGGTAYMVGEQGPELVIPEQNSRVVAADDVEAAAAAGPAINANFTIQAIDATNMQETLTAQRGNIIGMIREAANASGETFLETVDTLGLTSQGAE